MYINTIVESFFNTKTCGNTTAVENWNNDLIGHDALLFNLAALYQLGNIVAKFLGNAS